jgi:Flp pilus assembly protein TadB
MLSIIFWIGVALIVFGVLMLVLKLTNAIDWSVLPYFMAGFGLVAGLGLVWLEYAKKKDKRFIKNMPQMDEMVQPLR